jgi:hypothetical protein
MKLLNFELAAPSFAIELVGLDFVWDLHNAATFLGVNLDAASNTGSMKWAVSGHPASRYTGCSLIFTGLKLLVVSARDHDLPLSEDLCVSGISKVLPDPLTESPLSMKPEWNENEPFHLLFEFQSRRSIEIDAETVELAGW